ncbi:hypothetical protein KIPB_017267, partial [Kipferlia bialata]|eukprot:g17267.t1
MFELGRWDLAMRTGLISKIVRKGYGLVVAGSVIRWRRPARMFQKVIVHTKVVHQDAQYWFIKQEMASTRGKVMCTAMF